MDVIVLLARLLLAAVFGVAGVAKLADSRGSRQSMAAFGVPVRWTPAFAWLVPLAELTCAMALVTARWAWWGAIAAGTLLVAFTAAIAVNMALGRKPDCHCFGQLRVSPVGWSTLCRNVVLAGLAGFLATHGAGNTGPGLTAALTALSGGRFVVPAWAVAVVAAWLFAGVWLYLSLQQNERGPHRDVSGAPSQPRATDWVPPVPMGPELATGATAPAFSVNNLDGRTVTLDILQESGKPILLLFIRPHCPGCDGVLPDVGRWQQEHAERLVVVPISKQSVEANREKARKHNLQGVLVQQANEVGDDYRIEQLPSAVWVANGHIASPLAVGRDAIRTLVETILSHEP